MQKTAAGHPAAGLSMASMKSIEANRRAFYRQLKKVVEKADVILVVLDARDPLVRPMTPGAMAAGVMVRGKGGGGAWVAGKGAA